jgi:MinD-like ATPase involved in chromosome partitioning or flagellar assembly
MNNRDPYRGVLQQSVPSSSPPGPRPRHRPPPDRRVRPGPDPNAATRPNRPDPPAYRQPPRPPRTPTPNPATSATPAAPIRAQPVPGWAEFDALEAEQQAEAPPQFSWRKLLDRITRVNLRPGGDQSYELKLRDRIRASVGSAFPIAVLGLKGGVGKTAVVEALGSTFADVRDDRVIAVDIDGGDLADRHGRRSPLSMADLLADRPVSRHLDVRAHTYMNSSRLEVLGPPDYAQSDWRIERDDFVKLFSMLRNHYSVVLVDCGKALNSAVMEAVLRESRALVLVTGVTLDTVRRTATALDWLRNNGYQKLLDSTMLAINHTEPGKLNAVVSKELAQLSGQVASTVELPFDRHVREGREISLERLNKQSRLRYLRMAAVLAGMFPNRDMRRL